MNSFQLKYGNITLYDFNNRKEEFKEEYLYLRNSKSIKLREFRDFIYSLQMSEYKKDKIWEYLNNDISSMDFSSFVDGVYTGRRGKSAFYKNKRI